MYKPELDKGIYHNHMININCVGNIGFEIQLRESISKANKGHKRRNTAKKAIMTELNIKTRLDHKIGNNEKQKPEIFRNFQTTILIVANEYS